MSINYYHIDMDLATHFLDDVTFQYRKLKQLAEKALLQVNEDQFHHFIDEESNSIALLIKHMSGNMQSRWTDFLTTDGEKPFRDRPGEFDQKDRRSRDQFMSDWNKSWDLLFRTIEEIGPDQLLETITIRQEKFTVVEALHRQLTHYAAHIGQLVFLAKHFKQGKWNTLSIPRDQEKYTGGSYKQNLT